MLFCCSLALLALLVSPALSIFNEFLTANEPSANVSAMDNSSFVFVDTVHPNITSNLRYAIEENFIGRPLEAMPPSSANRSLLTRDAAEALARAEELFERDGFRIVVHGAYRPQAGSDEFAAWLRDPNAEQRRKAEHYPHVEKDNLAHLWYVDTRSGHSRGSSVDVAIMRANASLKPIEAQERWLRDGRRVLYLDDGTEDMGSHIDLFDEASHHDSPLVNESQVAMRNYLKRVMQSVGFAPFVKEWWHYTLRDEPFPDTYFNFTLE